MLPLTYFSLQLCQLLVLLFPLFLLLQKCREPNQVVLDQRVLLLQLLLSNATTLLLPKNKHWFLTLSSTAIGVCFLLFKVFLLVLECLLDLVHDSALLEETSGRRDHVQHHVLGHGDLLFILALHLFNYNND